MRNRLPFFSIIAIFLLSISITAQTVWPTKRWPTTTPQSVGLSLKTLAALDADLAAGKFGYVDSMLVIRHGKVAYDRRYKHDYAAIYGEQAKHAGPDNLHDITGPYNYFNIWWHPWLHGGDLHTMQSVTKTVTSVVIGAAVANKEFPDLDTPILKYFDTAKVENVDDRKRRITIRHLLTMTAGFQWDEESGTYDSPYNSAVQMESSCDWVKFTLDRPMAQEPGKAYRYNSGATQLLSRIFRAATGRDIEEYAARHLFTPLGIDHFYWKRSPSGLIDTEGGLYLQPHDLAKIGYLFLNNGRWAGKQIVTPEWVRQSVTPYVETSQPSVMYGYKWGLRPYGNRSKYAWTASGYGGQKLIVIPEYDVVVVFTSWSIPQTKFTWPIALRRIVEAVPK